MYVPDDPPANCPACGDPYESVSRHTDGFVANLHDNQRYRRVCFHPATDDGDAAFDCYHHTHGQAGGGKRDGTDDRTGTGENETSE